MEPGRDYLASDNYFFPEQKKYHIHEGFIKLIKILIRGKNPSGVPVFRETTTT
jgi:hypothetical protein